MSQGMHAHMDHQRQIDLDTAKFIRAVADQVAMGRPISIDLAQQVCGIMQVQGSRIAFALEKLAAEES